jgi:hypothetical protein
MNTKALPAATTPVELPQQLSLSVVTLPTVAAGLPLMNTFKEQPPLISPVKGRVPCGVA